MNKYLLKLRIDAYKADPWCGISHLLESENCYDCCMYCSHMSEKLLSRCPKIELSVLDSYKYKKNKFIPLLR